MENNNKKTLILSILGVLVLVIAVVGVSFAMYSFSATGETTNVITTGKVVINYENESVFTLTNAYPMSDALGAAQTTNLSFDVTSDITGKIKIAYEIGISDLKFTDNAATPATVTTFGPGDVKFNLSRTKGTDTSTTTYLFGSATTGVLLSTRTSSNGSYITGYYLDGQTFDTTSTGSSSDYYHYVLTAWVSDAYNLPGQKALDGCSKAGYNTKAECEAAKGTWTAANANVAGVASTTNGTCTDGTSTTKATCEAATAVWTVSGTCSVAGNTTESACTGASGTWTDTSKCSNPAYSTKTTCEAGKQAWTASTIVHADETDVVKMTFKIKVVAKQISA